MPQSYTREQLSEARRQAEANGDEEAVRAITAQLDAINTGEMQTNPAASLRGRVTDGGDYTREEIDQARRRAEASGDTESARALGEVLQAMDNPEVGMEVNVSPLPENETRPQEEDIGGSYTREFLRPVGSAVEGAGDLLGFLGGNAVGQGLYNIAGYGDRRYDMGEIAREGLGLPRMSSDIAHEGVAAAGGGLGFAKLAGLASSVVPATSARAQGVRGALSNIAATPGRDTVASAAGGAAVEATEDMGPGAQTVAGLASGYLGYRAAGIPGRLSGGISANSPEARAIAFGEQNNVPVMTTDVMPPRGFTGRIVQATGERIPYAGTGGPRVAQNEGRIRIVRGLANDYGVIPNGDDYLQDVADNLSRTRSTRIANLSGRKNEVIDSIHVPFGGAPNAVRAISEQVRRLRDIDAEEFAPVIERLQRFGQRLQSGNMTLRQVEEQRRLLGDLFQDPNLASIRGRGQQAINAIYDPLRTDMGEFIQQNGQSGQFERWQTANRELAEMAGELDVSTFRNVLRNTDATPENVSRLLFSRRPSDVRRLMENLGPRGQENARSAIVYEILRRSGSDSELRNISPNRVVNTMRQMGNSIGVAFDGTEATRMEGLERFLDMTRRAADASAAPPTGVQNTVPVLAAVLTDVMGGLGAATTTAGLMGGLARAYESAPVRNALLRLGRQEPNSPAAARTSAQILRIMESQGALTAVNDNAANIGSAVAQDEQE